MTDSLGFFSAAALTSDSESEDDEKPSPKKEKLPSVEKDEAELPSGERAGKLPSPTTLFKTVGRPDFLAKPDREIDWYDLTSKGDDDSDALYSLSSVPPPSSLKSLPIKYTSGSGGEKRPANESSYGESSLPKKEKRESETFRQKEKRKRDRGQASRGKNYVEEEKRVLKQSARAGLGFD